MALEERFIIQERFQNGSYLRCKSKTDNREVIIKQISFGSMNEKQKKKLIEQVNTLMSIKSPNIVKYQDYIIDKIKMSLYIITEFCSGGSLQKYLNLNRQQQKKIQEKAIWKIFSEVVSAVNEIHNDKKGLILHRDIRPESIFLDKDNNVKLGNFNLLRRLSPTEQFAQTSLPNTYYRSPEQICEGKFTAKSDIWALGCLLYQMAALKVPFETGSQFLTCRLIKENEPDPIHKGYSKQLNRVMKWCLCKQIEKRPSISVLMSIPQINYRIRNRRVQENKKLYEQKQKKISQKQFKIKQMEAQLAHLQIKAEQQDKQNMYINSNMSNNWL